MLNHKWAPKFAQFIKDNNLKFTDIYQLNKSILDFCQSYQKKNSEDDPVGLIEEVVYGEFALPRILFDIKEIIETSANKHERGIDFIIKFKDGTKGFLQVKSHHDPNTKFGVNKNSANSLSTFMDETFELDRNHTLLLVPNLEHNPEENKTIFEDDFKAQSKIRVISRSQIQQHILTKDKTFFKDLEKALLETLEKKIEYKDFPKSSWQWLHQDKMVMGAKKILRKKGDRGWFCIPTGGGKSLPMFKIILEAFKMGKNVQAIVAPKLALLQQHLSEMELYNFFNKHEIIPVAFHSGKMILLDSNIEIFQTLKPEELLKFIKNNSKKRILIFTTYVSDEAFLNSDNGISSEGKIEPDENLTEISKYVEVIHFDEFHHLATQTEHNMQYISNLLGNVFFYSASVVKGHLFSTTSEKFENGALAFGKKLFQMSMKDLQKLGIIVPKFKLGFIKAYEIKTKVESILKDYATQKGFDLKKAVKEISSTIFVANDVYKKEKVCKLLLYTKYSEYVKAFQDNWDELKKLLNFNSKIMLVLGSTNYRDRKELLQLVDDCDNCIFLNHSVMIEGIDKDSFNTIIFGRFPGQIVLQQGIGRGARTVQEDKKKFLEKEFNINDKDLYKKMKKHCCHVYFIMQDESIDVQQIDIEKMCKKLILTGWTEEDIQKAILPEKTKKKHISPTDLIDVEKIIIDNKVIEKTIDKIKQESIDIEFSQKVNALDKVSLIELL